MYFLWTILIGFIVGALAKMLMGQKNPDSFLLTACLGMAGALVAGILGRAIGHYGPTDNAGFITSILGAVILLAVYRWIRHARGVGH